MKHLLIQTAIVICCCTKFFIGNNGQIQHSKKDKGHNNGPLSFDSPGPIEEKDTISGAWECSAKGLSFIMDLKVKKGKLNGKIRGQSLEFKGGIIFQDSIRALMTDSMKRMFYTLAFKIEKNCLNGRFKASIEGVSGLLSGQKLKKPLTASSPQPE